MTTLIQETAVADLKPSPFPVQAERRAHYGEDQLRELADNIKQVGIVQPIVARQVNGHLEIVAGERRWLAAQKAGLENAPVWIRELNDQQALEVQLVENLQREGLHELAEAEGYETLMRKHGYDIEQLVAKVGKSRSYVYARLKLLALCDAARKTFYAGDLTASTALLLARIPGEDQQQRALKHITEKDWHGRVMSYRDAARYVHDTFMLKLSEAPFPREDATLVPSAGACGACPMRTGNAPDLFGDVKGADVCTNPPCFQAKKAAHAKRELEKAKSTGEHVIRGSAARKILPPTRGYASYAYSSDGSHKQLRNGYARPRDKCLDDPKKRTYAELAGKDAPKVLLQNPDTGRVERVFKIEVIADLLKAKGIKVAPPAQDPKEAREQDQARQEQVRKVELRARQAIFQAVLHAAPTTLSHDDLAALLIRTFDLGYGADDDFYGALGWPAPKAASGRSGAREQFIERLLKVSDAELAQLAVALPVIDEVLDDWGKPTALEALAKRFHVDTKKVRAETAAQDTKPAAAAPKAPKKASAKPKTKTRSKEAQKTTKAKGGKG